MSRIDRLNIEDIQGIRVKTFQKLMRFKIRDILLVSSLYDNYLFEEDGRLYELIRSEFQTLNLSHPPEMMHVSSGGEALELLQSDAEHFDLIITTLHIEDMHVIKFAQSVRDAGFDIPMVLLAYDNRERKDLVTNYDISMFDKIFTWQGDYHLLIGIIKYIEDLRNVENDTLTSGVQSIILLEDSVQFYSVYLPLIYTEILKQSQRLISEGVNLTHRFLRMRARPKILLCTTFEEALTYYEKYQDFVLGIITDVNIRKGNAKETEAGIEFARLVKAQHDDIPILIQSSNAEFSTRAREIGASFLLKSSPRLLHDLREFMLNNFGFGDFSFRLNDGREVSRATNLRELEEQLKTVPDESILFHARRNHFSNWLKARAEFWLAQQLRPKRPEDFESVGQLRELLINSLQKYREIQQRGAITEFSKDTFDPQNSFARIGGGSLGGKARGLGFINTLINSYNIRDKFPGVEVHVPSAIVIATDVFDRFLAENHLEAFALQVDNDDELQRLFTGAPAFPPEIVHTLQEFLEITHTPLAVRSSSLLEDSQYQPFAGVYQTYMIANNNPDLEVRLSELLQAIKLVYASTFSKHAKDYMKATAYRLEEEKMAVIVQRMVGSSRNGRYYPDFAGVAKSYNFYPVPPQKPSDGIVLVGLGLGKTVVDGGNVVRFCPKYPRHLLQFFSAEETLKNAQLEFYALNIEESLKHANSRAPNEFVQKFDLRKAEEDQTLFHVASTYSPENDMVYDGMSRSGRRVVTFAPILKHGLFPLAAVLDLVIEMGAWGMGTHVEIEFAVNMSTTARTPHEFAFLQIRPLVLSAEVEEIEIGKIDRAELVCQSDQVLGSGVTRDIHDLVVVDIDKFERTKSHDVAQEVSQLNTKLLTQKRPYVLIGVGRWGSLDQWLGIPVMWDQISGASAIVESGFKDFEVTPSQGSHFFQNITSFRIGYFTVNSFTHHGFIDWEWLAQQPAVEELAFTRHLRFDEAITVKINGHKNVGVILKPGK